MANKGVNKAIIVGNLGNDPEMRYLPSGNAVTTISVATSESWTDKNTGQPQERTEWHRIEAFGKLAEIMGQYLKKGSQVYIEGSIRTDRYTGQDGIEKFSTKIRADQLQMLGGRPGGGESAPFNQGQGAPMQQQPQQNNYGAPQGGQQAQPTQHAQSSGAFAAPKVDAADDFSDDIPF